ncbi:MAG: UbiA family prenyltransferase [Candidatus Marinimicrobia bacterium]|jgi:4-hydroxybenzoate polyprenyltransferase|nr:UbiA family prenyltransferase [Candidatus Neomarinimicrobiota bacterium]MBT3634654.1 UbiA family prenyltransferase [Candidatus Neomarinimicrobiota bacterium]MBT3682716.1 UbiA family prenyltransferase [Candidatus Neomarinimicrobiota bacterium]MBT3759629.1 UbiA family prenyltransferase [Candidatus Neomarinimicrobiota bacterium]MBT3894499.1 UbiA family prenyltransferase [Candidatus Neomarinimicrobiota bacterium]
MILRFLKNPVHKNFVPFLDNLFLLRPTLFFPVWVMVTAGMTASIMNISRYQVWLSDFDFFTLALFIGITLISGSTFIINQIQDMESDALNQKLFLVGKKVHIELAQKIQKMTLILGFIFLLISGYMALIMGALLFLFWGYLYNIKPFHWKKKPLLGMFANSMAGLILYSAGWIHVASSEGLSFMNFGWLEMFLISIPYLLCYTAVSLLTTIPDMDGDEPTGAITFPVKFGLRTTIALAGTMVLAAFWLGWSYDDPVSTTSAIMSFPFYVVALIRNQNKDVLRAIRYSIFILAFLLFTVYPLLLPAVLVVFYLSKYYYWHRFNLHYPTFLVDEVEE